MTKATGGLYVCRKLTAQSAAAFTAWAHAQGFGETTLPQELHATIVHSVDPVNLEPLGGLITAEEGKREVRMLGDRGAIVLTFRSKELSRRWSQAVDAGAFSTWQGFTPHVTITYDYPPGLDLDAIEPYDGLLEFGPEEHSTLNLDWTSFQRITSFEVDAMALNISNDGGHPNKMPFRGILTRIDTPSDAPPGGSGGKNIILPRWVAEYALPSLLGMAVDYTPRFDGHDVTRKIGIVTEAEIEGDAVHIAGFIYAADFPEVAQKIKQDQSKLGFSYELKQVFVIDPKADPMVIESCVFTGAAILKKDKAAYRTTSLAAARARLAKGEIDMTPEQLAAAIEAAMGKAMAPIIVRLDKVEASTGQLTTDLAAAREISAKVKPFSEQIRASASSLAAAGIGVDAENGHVAVLNRMADHMDMEAGLGRVPQIYAGNDFFKRNSDQSPAGKELAAAMEAKDKALADLKAQVDDLTTKLGDVSAKAFNKSEAPERKTISVDAAALMSKFGITAEEGKKVDVATVDQALKAMNVTGTRAIEAKLRLRAEGLIA